MKNLLNIYLQNLYRTFIPIIFVFPMIFVSLLNVVIVILNDDNNILLNVKETEDINTFILKYILLLYFFI